MSQININKTSDNSREATTQEIQAISDFLAIDYSKAEFGEDDYDIGTYMDVWGEVNMATIRVFPNFYPDGNHQVWLAWSRVGNLPPHFEHFFMLSKDGTQVKRVDLNTKQK